MSSPQQLMRPLFIVLLDPTELEEANALRALLVAGHQLVQKYATYVPPGNLRMTTCLATTAPPVNIRETLKVAA